MTTTEQLNDPEYRWQHKEEMSKIMPYATERKRLGLIVLNYDELRGKNDETIKVDPKRRLDWGMFQSLINRVPNNIDTTLKKSPLEPIDRLHFETRDKGICYICGVVFHYGSCNKYSSTTKTYKLSHLHHVIPNGSVSEKNIVTLCTHCHQIVHQALYLAGKWKYARPL